jgi:hypothetical protein
MACDANEVLRYDDAFIDDAGNPWSDGIRHGKLFC